MGTDSSSASEQNATPSSATAPIPYHTPSWFLQHNVKTVAQLQCFKPSLQFVKPKHKIDGNNKSNEEVTTDDQDVNENSKEAEEDDERREPNSQDDSRRAAFCVHKETFMSVRDTLASALVRDRRNALPKDNLGAMLRCNKEESCVVFEQYVGALAKELGATLVTLTLHHLQALAACYEDRTSRKCPSDSDNDRDGFHLPYNLMLRFFGSLSSTNEAREVHKRAYAAIFAAQEPCVSDVTRGELSTVEEEEADAEAADEEAQEEDADNELPEVDATGDEAREHEEEEEKTDGDAEEDAPEPSPAYHPLLLHIAEGQLLVGERFARVLAGLRGFARTERKRGRPIILVITCTLEDYYIGPAQLGFLRRKCGISSFASFILEYVDVPSALKRRAGSETTIPPKLVTDLKSLLLSKARQHFDAEILLPHAKWDLQFEKSVKNLEGQGDHLLQTIAAQIVGRALDKPKLELSDIAHVLLQVSLARQLEREAEEESEMTESTSGTSIIDVELPPIVITDKYERNLASSLVKAAELRATKYEDVILNDDIKDTMKQLVLLSRIKIDTKSTFLLSSLQIKGALMYGVPGTGKTHLSRAMASSLGSNMLAVDSAALRCMYVGETEKHIRAAFSLARKHTPCILFFDEVDALFYRRSSNDRTWERAALTQFLKEMDGLQTGASSDAPFVLVATNRPGDLDSAFLRRLPQKICFELPDVAARAKILRVLLSEKDLAADVDVEKLAKQTEGYTGSDLKNLCAEAALLWVIELSREEAKASESANGEVAERKESGSSESRPIMCNGSENVQTSTQDHAPEATSTELDVDSSTDDGDPKTTAQARMKPKDKKDRTQATSLDVDKLMNVCLTDAHFQKALQKIKPTTTPEALWEINRFATLFNKKSDS